MTEAFEAAPPSWWSSVERDLRAPFPWFGGKSRVASLVWERFGEVVNYVEPFAGSLAVLLGRPHAPTIETVNDLDGHLANVWRAIRTAPDAVAEAADWPVNEVDLHARHRYLTKLRGKLAARLLAEPAYCAPMIAGWWIWGLCAWIGSGWCGKGAGWNQPPHLAAPSGDGPARPDYGRGVHARGMRGGQLPRLAGGGANEAPIANHGAGVHSGSMRSAGQLPAIGGGGASNAGINGVGTRSRLPEVFEALSTRLRYTRVTCGDFERILSPAVTWRHGTTGVFLDPPYPSDAGSTGGLYTSATAEREVFDRAFRYALANGADKRLRIAFCYYEGTLVDGADVSERFRAAGWDVVPWKARGGYGGQSADGNENARRERIAFSPGCLRSIQGKLFGGT
jgi:hypothetical protein